MGETQLSPSHNINEDVQYIYYSENTCILACFPLGWLAMCIVLEPLYLHVMCIVASSITHIMSEGHSQLSLSLIMLGIQIQILFTVHC